jgi:hypothetical protein
MLRFGGLDVLMLDLLSQQKSDPPRYECGNCTHHLFRVWWRFDWRNPGLNSSDFTPKLLPRELAGHGLKG